jgi:hypothetical protein
VAGMKIFAPAIRQLTPGGWSVFGPTSFQRYLREHGFTQRVDTASAISVDSLDRLAPELREAGAMVLRLGKAPDGPGTQFALIGTPGRLNDYFLIDHEVFTQVEPAVYRPSQNLRDLLPYYLLPKLTERCMVNLAFASGLIGHALGLDEPWPTAAPATGSGTYSFSFRPYPGAPLLHHREGQVEIDAIFAGRRGGRDVVFVLESKMGAPGSLAKHKLVYPVLALADKVAPQAELVPVYLRCQEDGDGVTYHLVECGFDLHDPCLYGLYPRGYNCVHMSLSDYAWKGVSTC